MAKDLYPNKDDLQKFVDARYRTAWVWQTVFLSALLIAILALSALILNVVDGAFGYVVYEFKKDPALVSEKPIDDLNQTELIALLKDNLSRGAYNKLNNEKVMETRSEGELYGLVIERIIQVKTLKTYPLFESLFNRAAIEAEVAEKFPGARLEFRSWLTPDFLTTPMSSRAEFAGVRTALFGTLWMVSIAISFALPVGIGAAIYLQEYASKKSLMNKIIQTNINNLAGVPSIIYGILGLALFVRALEPLTSGAVFGLTDPTTANGRTILSAGLTLALLVLPVIIINAQEALRAVPGILRQSSLAVGATKWQTVWHHVLPASFDRILTGTVLAVSRAIGETAPLVVVGASTFLSRDPTSIFSKFTTLPIQIYQWTARPQEEFRRVAAAAILVLLILMLSLNAIAILMRNRIRAKKRLSR